MFTCAEKFTASRQAPLGCTSFEHVCYRETLVVSRNGIASVAASGPLRAPMQQVAPHYGSIHFSSLLFRASLPYRASPPHQNDSFRSASIRSRSRGGFRSHRRLSRSLPLALASLKLSTASPPWHTEGASLRSPQAAHTSLRASRLATSPRRRRGSARRLWNWRRRGLRTAPMSASL